MLFSRLLIVSGIFTQSCFFWQTFRSICSPFVHAECRETRKTKEIITRGGITATGKAEVEENGVYMKGMGEQRVVARSDGMKRKGGKRERAGVFAIIIIAGFLPRMLREQQVAVLARATRNSTDKSFGITTNRNRSPVISEPRWRLDYRRRLKSDLDCAVEVEKISKPSFRSRVVSHL